MPLIFHKDTLKIIFLGISSFYIISCVPKHKFEFEKNTLSYQKMAAVLTDIFLMESYVSEKMVSAQPDSITAVKRSFSKQILAYHHIDSAAFYSTYNYLQAHPKELAGVLTLVDSSISRIRPGDTTTVIQHLPASMGEEGTGAIQFQDKRMKQEFEQRRKAFKESQLKNQHK